MRLKEMFRSVQTDPDFKGYVTTDQMVLAVDITPDQSADPDDYAVAYMGGADRSSSLNPEEKTTAYYYHGKSTTKTGNQRTIDFTEDRYVEDEFQDFVFSFDMKYATGQKAIVNYVYFNTLTGEGEKGSGTLIISDDGSGAPEENLSVSGSIKKAGAQPEKFIYQGFGGYEALANQPNDWETKYSSYFTRKNGAFVPVSGDNATFEKGKFYGKKAENEDPTDEK